MLFPSAAAAAAGRPPLCLRNLDLPFSGAFYELAFPETARQFSGGRRDKEEIYRQQDADRPEEVGEDLHVT